MASLETLRFAKTSIQTARLKAEGLVDEALSFLTGKGMPVEQRMADLRTYVRGVLNGHDDVLRQVRTLVPEERFTQLKNNAAKVAAPAADMSSRFDAKLQPIVAGNEKGQSRAKTAIDELSKRIRDLAVWEGMLDQLIAETGTNGEARPAAAAAEKPAEKPVAAPAAKPETKPETKREAKPEAKAPVIRPAVVKPPVKPAAPKEKQDFEDPPELSPEDIANFLDDSLPLPAPEELDAQIDEFVSQAAPPKSAKSASNDHDTSDDFQLAPTEPTKPA